MLQKVPKTPAPTEEPTRIILPKLDQRSLSLMVVGDSSLICHNWSAKNKKEMLDKQMKKAKGPREAKDPQKDFEDSLYIAEHKGKKIYVFPSVAFKNAAVTACTSIAGSGVTKIMARQAFHIDDEFVQIHGEPKMREDTVRIAMGVADIRYRADFSKWHATLKVSFNANVLSPEQIGNLFNIAGFAVGVGDWRPERSGSHGRFHVGSPNAASN